LEFDLCLKPNGVAEMSKFMVNLTAVNPSERQRRTSPVEVMVDTGSELSK
jgi:hypothetical protein